jgi:hypothetical protein
MPASMRLRATEQRPPPWAVFLFPAKEVKMEYKKPIPTERLIFQEGRYVKCIYFSLVIKMEALENKYPGGPKGFSERYIFKCNRDIAVIVAMSFGYLDEVMIDLEKAGLVYGKDTFIFDATRLGVWHTCHAKDDKVDIRVDWLVGEAFHGDALAVGLKEERMVLEPSEKCTRWGTDMSMIGIKIPTDRPFLVKALSKADPIYKLGYIVGYRSLKNSSKNTKAKSSSNESPTPSKPKDSGEE